MLQPWNTWPVTPLQPLPKGSSQTPESVSAMPDVIGRAGPIQRRVVGIAEAETEVGFEWRIAKE